MNGIGIFLPSIRRYRRGKLHLTEAERTILFWSKVKRGPDCWEWQASRTKRGYGMFCIGRPLGGRHITGRAHRIAWQLENGPIPDGLNVCHHCDNASCCRPDHLFLGTQSDNMRDASRKGRLPRVCTLEVFAEALAAPRGGIAAVARKHGVNPRSLMQKVQRHRMRHQPAHLELAS